MARTPVLDIFYPEANGEFLPFDEYADLVEKVESLLYGLTGRANLRLYDCLNSINNTNPVIAALTATAWPAANRAVFCKIKPYRDTAIDTFDWSSGSASAANIDVGIYDGVGARIWHSGSVAAPGASASVTTNTGSVIDLDAGETYYLAAATDSTNGIMRGIAITTTMQTRQADSSFTHIYFNSAFPLPSSVNLAAPDGAATFIPFLLVRD